MSDLEIVAQTAVFEAANGYSSIKEATATIIKYVSENYVQAEPGGEEFDEGRME